MKRSKKWIALAIGTVAVATFALVFITMTPQAVSAHGGPGGFGRGGLAPRGSFDGVTKDNTLADALGISSEELQAAQQEANEAALDLAVKEGLVTQEQADAIKERGSRFGGFAKMGQFGRFGSSSIDGEALLAEALGIDVEELQTAREQAHDAALAAAVEAGRITQEQVDEMKSMQALKDYLDEQGLQDRLRSTYEEALAGAVAAGVITQEQADQLLENQRGFGMRGFDKEFGGRGFGGHGMHGRDMRGFGGRNIAPPADNTTTSTTFRF